MYIVEINAVPYGSTGRILFGIADVAQKSGNVCKCVHGFSWHKNKSPDSLIVSGFIAKSLHMLAARISGWNGSFSIISTYRFIRKLKKLSPDIIHLHNIHGWYLNIPMLFRFIKKSNIPIIWTLHDCWAFTGHCPHFVMHKCDQWKTACQNCSTYKEYPQSLFDNAKKMFQFKKKHFTGIENMTLVTPSRWLADLVNQSFLKDYPVKIINNGIDLNTFQPTEGNFRERYAIAPDKHIVLGVALDWGTRKGLDVFAALSKRLDEHYQIVLVGTNDKIDKQLPENILTIHRTHNQKELAEIYTAADVFVNPTREDNFPTVNIESIACGTPVITFRTGGSPEMLDETCGSVVDCDDIDAMEQEIIRVCKDKPYTKADCLHRAQNFDQDSKFHEYIELYENIGASHD